VQISGGMGGRRPTTTVGVRKLESLGYHITWRYLCDPKFSHFDNTSV